MRNKRAVGQEFDSFSKLCIVSSTRMLERTSRKSTLRKSGLAPTSRPSKAFIHRPIRGPVQLHSRSPLSLPFSQWSHLCVNRLNILPKINVIDAQLRMMTLYGIEKSGIGSPVVCRDWGEDVEGKVPASHSIRRVFGILQEGSMERRRVLLSGIAGVACGVDGPWCPFARRIMGW